MGLLNKGLQENKGTVISNTSSWSSIFYQILEANMKKKPVI